MATTKLNMTLLLRRGEFADSFVLQAGEPGYHTGTKEFKIGDGTTTWSALDFANETEIRAIIKNIEDNYATDEEVRVIKEALEASIKGINDELDTYGDIVTHNVAEFDAAGAAQTAKEELVETLKSYHTAAEADAKFETIENVALKADKSVVDAMYTNDAIDALIQSAKDYADSNDADTTYGITYDSDNKKIKLVEGGTTFEIDASEFIKDGMINTVTINEDDDLVITFNTDSGKEDIVLPLDQLVDIYTGSEGTTVKVFVASDKTISAEVVAGSIGLTQLDDSVKESLALANTALQAADLADYAKSADVTEEIAQAVAPKLDTTVYNEYVSDRQLTDTQITDALNGKDSAGAAAQALADAKQYADENDDNTTYTVAPTANALEFTLTPSEGEAQTVTLVAPVVDTGVMNVVADTANSVLSVTVVNGVATVTHKDYETGVIKDANYTDNNPSFVTGITVENGHVTSATVTKLTDALAALEGLVLDGGSSI